jgi:hypothetical protein
VHDSASAILGHVLYVFGGGSTTSLATIQAIPLGSAAAPTVHPLPEPLADLAAVVHGGVVYLIGGTTGATASNQVWRWSPAAGVSLVARLPTGIRYAGAAWYANRLVIAGGMVPAGSSDTYSDTVYAVNPATGSVSRLDPLPVPVIYAALGTFRGALYLAGGLTVSGATDAVWRYTGPGRGWVAAPQALPVATYRGALATFAHRLWYVGGLTASGAPTARVWMSAAAPSARGRGP